MPVRQRSRKSRCRKAGMCATVASGQSSGIFLAWLARFVVNHKLDAGQAQAAWPGADSFLRAASSEVQPAMGQGQPKPNLVPAQVGQGQSRSSVHSGKRVSETCHGARSAVTSKAARQPEPPPFGVGSSQNSICRRKRITIFSN